MKLNIQKCSLLEKYGPYSLDINERLPFFINKVEEVEFYYTVERFKDYYLLTTDVSACVNIECQRCLQPFVYNYKNFSKIAVCKSEEVAERVMEEFDPIVSLTNEVDFVEIITDDLHLYCPEMHDEMCIK